MCQNIISFAVIMLSLTSTEENYLKVIFGLSKETDGKSKIANLAIADKLNINPATVTEMLRKLYEKKLIEYNRIDGATLTKKGLSLALTIIRKHRLWETFLEQKLCFNWDEVHDVAEQLEHIQSEKLIDKLDEFLGRPQYDPHGDPIPNSNGEVPESNAFPLSQIKEAGWYKVCGVANESAPFLQYLDRIQLNINDIVEVKEIQEFDHSLSVVLHKTHNTMFSNEVAKNLYVESV